MYEMKTALSVMLCLMMLCVSSMVFSAPSPKAMPLEKVRLQLKWFHQFQFAGYYAAKEQGFYAQEGLDVELLERFGDKDTVKQVTLGEVEYAVGDSGILSSYARGEPIVALAAIFQHNPLVFLAKQSSGIMSPYEMRGKRIMLDTVGAGGVPLRALLAEANLDDKSYTTVKQSFRNDDLIEDKFDVMLAYLSDQLFYFQEKGLKVNVINPQSYGIDFYGDILFTSERELMTYPERVEKFRRASLKGWQYALEHPEELIELIHTKYHSKLSVPHLRFEADITRKLILPDVIPLGQIDSRRLQKIAEMYAQLGFSRPLTEADLARFIYSSHSLILTAQEQAWLKNHPKIYLGIDRDFAPYEWIDAKGNYVGLVADYIAVFEKTLGVKFIVIKDKPWSEILAMAQQGKLDMIAAAVKTPERSQYLTFTKSYISNPIIIVNDTRLGFIGSLNQLNGKQVVLEKGYFMQELLKRDYPNIQLVIANNVKEALSQVAESKADAYVGDAASANYAIQQLGTLDLRFSGNTGYVSSHSVAVVKTHPQLASIMDKVIAAIPPIEQERINNRWMASKIPNQISRKTVLKYGLGMLVVFFVFMGWNIRLRREITARKLAKALAIKERNLAQQYLDIAGVMLVALDTAGKIILVNRRGCEILGYAEQELLKQEWFFLCVHETYRIEALKTFIQLMTNEFDVDKSHECLVMTKTGLQRTISFQHNVFKDDKGNITGILSSGEDITERKVTEQQLRTLSVAVEQSPASVVITDLTPYLLYVNPQFCHVTGYSSEEALGKNPSILKSGLTPIERYQELWANLKSGKVWHGEFINRRKSGEIYWEEVHVSPVKDLSGMITHYVGIKIDISERKKAEQRLQESEQKLLAILENVSAYIYLKDCEGRYLFANRLVRELWQAEMDDIIGFKDDKFFDQQTAAQIRLNDLRVLLDGEILQTEETNTAIKTGATQVFWSVKLPLRREDGSIYALCGISTDISEQKKIEENLRQAKEMAEKASRLKSEFLANMSHEIRTPMNAILGFSSILAGLITDPLQHYYLEAIERSGKTLLQLINDILDLSKIEAGKLNLKYEPVSIRALLNDIKIIFSPQTAYKSIDFSLSVAENIPDYLLLDEIRMRQVFLNLVGNAVKFTETGFIRITVSVEAVLENSVIDLTIKVCDSGIGIAENQQEQIFLAFTQQAQQSVVYGGTGLGLTICKRLIDLMHGKVSVESQLGQGSCFIVHLDNVEIYKQDLPVIKQASYLQALAPKFSPATVLLVDDVESNRMLIRSYLADFPELNLIEAQTGEQALELITQQRCDLILMDRRLPGENGDQICQKIKTFPEYANVPVIMITASVLSTTEEKYPYAFDIQLDKPVKKEQLLEAMQLFLGCETETVADESLISNASIIKSPIDIEQLTALIALLNSVYLPQVTAFRQSDIFYIEELIEIAKRLMSVAQDYQCNALYEWAATLKNQAELFDLTNLPKTLADFDNLITHLIQLQVK
jgi:PAS domain S-box-containing protein